MEWKKQYSVGISRFDEDHKILFDLIDQVQMGSANLSTPDQVRSIFDVLQDYVTNHFRREEELMAAQAYPGIIEHQAHHEALKKGLAALRSRYDEDDTTVLPDLGPFLNNWLQIHILEQDMAYKAYFDKTMSPEERAGIT